MEKITNESFKLENGEEVEKFQNSHSYDDVILFNECLFEE